MTLLEAIEHLNSSDESHTIYAAEPWTFDSRTIVALEPEIGGVPIDVQSAGLKYFLEVFLANELLESVDTTLPAEKCARLIQYAKTDA